MALGSVASPWTDSCRTNPHAFNYARVFYVGQGLCPSLPHVRLDDPSQAHASTPALRRPRLTSTATANSPRHTQLTTSSCQTVTPQGVPW